MVTTDRYKNAIQSLWVGRATITVLDHTTNPANGRSEPTERVAVQDEPCRISHVTVRSTSPDSGAARVAQSVMLYTDPSVVIPEGSKITVTQNGVTAIYERSGQPAVFTWHQEVPLELFRGWA